MASIMAFVAAFWLVAAGAGSTLVRLFDRKGALWRSERITIGFGLGCLLLYLGVALVGPFRLDRLSVGAVLAVAAAIALPSWREWARMRPKLGALADSCRSHPFTAVVWGITGLSLASLLLQGMAPPNDYDSLMYHIALPRRDVEQGFIGPNWEHNLFSFFPALAEHLYRVALVTVGEAAAQCITGLFGIVLAVGTAALARRLGLSPAAAALAALMTVSVRATIWELATCEVEAILAFYAVVLLLAYLRWRDGGGLGAMVLFGLLAGAAVATKYHGLAIGLGLAVPITWDLVHRRGKVSEVAAGALAVLVVLLPHLVRDYVYTGNPLFPVMNHLLFPDGPAFYRDYGLEFGRPRGLVNLLRVYWDISILPTYHFDGAMLGTPYLLAFMPLAFANRPRPAPLFPIVSLIVVYTLVWYSTMSQQVRFLIPVTPVFAILASAGVLGLWVHSGRAARIALMAAVVALAVPQALFAGAYTALRLPAALGLVDRATYLTGTPTMNDNFYRSCQWVAERLGPSEQVLSLIIPHSYYCPQARAVIAPALPDEADYWLRGRSLPELTPAEMAAAIERHAIRWVVVERTRELRGGPTSAPRTVTRDLSTDRLGRALLPALAGVEPEFGDGTAAVYDARKLAEVLRR